MFNKLLAIVTFAVVFAQPAAAQSQNQLPFPFSQAPSSSARNSDEMEFTGPLLNQSMPSGNQFVRQPNINTGNLDDAQSNQGNRTEELKLPTRPLNGFQQFVFDTTGRIRAVLMMVTSPAKTSRG